MSGSHEGIAGKLCAPGKFRVPIARLSYVLRKLHVKSGIYLLAFVVRNRRIMLERATLSDASLGYVEYQGVSTVLAQAALPGGR
jgi:hypothetical protein